MSDIEAFEKGQTLIIEGVTENNEIFRPSDWAERLCGDLCIIQKRRMKYSPLLCPSVFHGNKCVLVHVTLEESHPELFASIMAFAKNNRLRITKT